MSANACRNLSLSDDESMIQVKRGLTRRVAGLRRHPRHFLQLLLPTALAALGWLALVLDWPRVSLLLVSAAILSFMALLWLRLRRIQARIDLVLRRTTMLQSQTMAIRSAPAPTPQQQPPAEPIQLEAALERSHESWNRSVLPVLAMTSGVAPGLLQALEEAAPEQGETALLVAPDSTRSASRTWARSMTGVPFESVGSSPREGTQRGRAAALDVIIIVDGDDGVDFAGVLDQSFFWWLPRDARLFVVSDDVPMFVSRLATAHAVELVVAERWPTTARIVVTRPRGALS